MMRHCCGSNDHPDSALFIQMYRLVSTYSLVKPVKGSNVAGDDIVKVLLNIKDIKDEKMRRMQWDDQIDSLLDRGRNCTALQDAASIIHEDHDYFKCSTSEYVLAYVAGFVVRKSQRFVKYRELNSSKQITCQECFKTLTFDKTQGKEFPDSFKLIQMKSKGYLYEPSLPLYDLISILERATLTIIQKNEINSETIFEITKAIENLTPLPLVGCEKHKMSLTHKIISFYLTTRMFFISNQANKNENIERERSREKRKAAKMVSTTGENVETKKKKN